MPPVPEPPDLSATGGTYDVDEAGIRFRHAPSLPTPADGEEFLSRLEAGLSLRVLDRAPNELVFELVGVDASFANALRRIMIAEVPTMALEHVYMWNNSGLIHDEVLAHRLGLVPLNVDPRLFDEYGHDVDDDRNLAATDRNTIVFRLNVACGRDAADDARIQKKMEAKWKAEGLVSGRDVSNGKNDPAGARTGGEDDENDGIHQRAKHTEPSNVDSEPSIMNLSIADEAAAEAVASSDARPTPIDPPHRPFTKHVYTRDFLWSPQGDQLARFPVGGAGGGIRPLHEDILLAKLRPGQAIELEAHARKGVGKDHAKFSPVATASYRLMPRIEIMKPVYDELAEELVNWFEPGVFRLEPAPEDGRRVRAAVSNPYAGTMSRNFMRHPVLKESIKMTRLPNHFIFSVESVGMMEPAVIVAEALKILKGKCETVSELADDALAMSE